MQQKVFFVSCQKMVYASLKYLRPSSLISISAPNLEIGPQGFIYASKCGNTIDAFSETD